jgi:primosomal protein N' (replication factor Y)
VAAVKPLKLKQERFQPSRQRALDLPYARVLVEHGVVHLEQEYDYLVPELLSEEARVGSLVEVEFGHSLTQGIILARFEKPQSAGEHKEILKLLSSLPYAFPEELRLASQVAENFGVNPWEIIRSCIPPFSKAGEKLLAQSSLATAELSGKEIPLPQSLREYLGKREQILCAVELPSSTPYWKLLAEIALSRRELGSVLILLPSERELKLLDEALNDRGVTPISILSTQGKSERYRNHLAARIVERGIALGLRSSSLLALPEGSTIILLDDVDNSHYEQRSPTWSTREMVELREGDHSVIYASTTVSLEIADRVARNALPFYRFPTPPPIKFQSKAEGSESTYFGLISQGLRKGSVLVSIGAKGYVTSFSCQQCRNIALCSCGGKLYFPSRGSNPRCATCSAQSLEWSCTWCHASKPRAIGTGVIRRAEEFGKAFSNYPVIHSSAQHVVTTLPTGNHLVLSTPGVEPRGDYAAIIFLDLEGRLMRTTLRATEELRLQIMRTLSMLHPGGAAYLDLAPAESFLQSILRGSPLLAAEREIEERSAAAFAPKFLNIVISGEPLESAKKVLEATSEVSVIGPFLKGERASLLVKAPKEKRADIIALLRGFNRVQSMRKEGLLSFQINPYSLN